MTRDELDSKALEAIRESRVKLYIFKPSGRRMWIVVGKHGRYLVLPDAEYCTCNDFFFRVMSGEKPSCYHILAVKKAVKEETYSIIEKEDTSYKRMLEDLLKEGNRIR
jgi:predicted nucleic acid-binding Zn finger protein